MSGNITDLSSTIDAAGNKLVDGLSTIELLLVVVIIAGGALAALVVRALWLRYTQLVDSTTTNNTNLAVALNNHTNAIQMLEAKIK